MDPNEVGLICPAPDANSFEVGGIVYTATDGLSVARLRMFQRLEIEFGADAGLAAHVGALDKVWAALNEARLATAIHELGFIRDSLNIVGKQRLRALEICSLFFNAPGEDPGVYDAAALTQKERAFAGLHAGFFTVAAPRLARTLWGSYGTLLESEPPKYNPERSATA